MAKVEFSPGLDHALIRASALARQAGADAVAPIHLFNALLAEEGMAWQLLADAGVNLAALRPADPTPEPEAGVPTPWSRSIRIILNRARAAAGWHGAEGTLTSDVVLLALLEHADNLRQGLIDHGLDWTRLAQQMPLEPPSIAIDEPLDLTAAGPSPEIARLLDAAANRAREALRVLEDYTRFVLNDAFLSEKLKTLRHNLAQALTELPTFSLLQARDTTGDVGTSITTEQEHSRQSAGDVLAANAKRLQEALRSLEEFGKLHSPALGQAVERLRYDAYTLERALTLGQDARSRLSDALLYVLLTEKHCKLSWQGVAREALEGGADVLQLREKDLPDRDLLARARALRKMTRDHGALFIVNDRPDIALLSEADGVHLGQDDLSLHDARRILGPNALVGISTHNLDQLGQAILDGASYVGIGPTFASQTKQFSDLAGLTYIQSASQASTLPAFALGGINHENLPQVVAAGAKRIAVAYSVCATDDPRAAAGALRRFLQAFYSRN